MSELDKALVLLAEYREAVRQARANGLAEKSRDGATALSVYRMMDIPLRVVQMLDAEPGEDSTHD